MQDKNTTIIKIIDYIANEINTDNHLKTMIKEKIISPIMYTFYLQLQPYIILLIGCVILVIISSICNLVFFALMYLKK